MNVAGLRASVEMDKATRRNTRVIYTGDTRYNGIRLDKIISKSMCNTTTNISQSLGFRLRYRCVCKTRHEAHSIRLLPRGRRDDTSTMVDLQRVRSRAMLEANASVVPSCLRSLVRTSLHRVRGAPRGLDHPAIYRRVEGVDDVGSMIEWRPE